MSTVTPELRTLIDSGPLAHVVTINPSGSPQVTVEAAGAPDLLRRLGPVNVGPGVTAGPEFEFPLGPDPAPGYLLRTHIEQDGPRAVMRIDQ